MAWVIAGASYLIIATVLSFIFQNFSDPDAFYHMGHAIVYTQYGPFYSDFPWAAYSVISKVGADLWWGFHILLIPFAWIQDSVFALNVAQCFLIFSFLILVYTFAKRHFIPLPWIWPLVALFSGPMELSRWIAIRPSALSFPLLLLLISFCTARNGALLPFLCGVAISFFHQTISWIAVPLILSSTVAVLLFEKRFAWKESLAALIGFSLPWILRPNPGGAIELMKIQILDLTRLKAEKLPLSFGTEVYPLSNSELLYNFAGFLLIWVIGLLFCVKIYKNLRNTPLSSHDISVLTIASIVSLLGFYITVLSSTRGLDLWIIFATASIALSIGKVVLETIKREYKAATISAIILGFTTLAVFSVSKVYELLDKSGINPYRLASAMQWAKANTEKNSILLSVHWASFGEMFFWNQHNRYLGGMDPVFIYTHNPSLYWGILRLEENRGSSFTSLSPPGEEAIPLSTYDFLSKEMKADYLLVVQPVNPDLYNYAKRENGFDLVYEEGPVAIFRIIKQKTNYFFA